MKIAICDDEKPFLDKLYQILQEIRMELNIPISIIKFIDGKELLNYFEVHKDIDVFILDILMNPINGYDVARKIRKMDNKVKLVFLTSIKNYAIAGYNIRLEKYILKPVSKKVMSKVILEIYNQLYRNGKFLIVKNVEGLFKLYFEDIYFIETEDKHVLIHTKDSSVKCYHCLKLLETSVYKGYKQDKIEMRGDRAEMSDFPLYLNTVAGGLDRRDQTIGGFSFVVKIYTVPVVEIIG